MVVKEVLMLGNPQLREISVNVTNFYEKLKILTQDLKETLTYLQKTRKIGRALAAPQINYMKKVIYYQLPNRQFFMINPKILTKSEEKIKVWDSCYSFDVAFFVEIERFKSILVEYQDQNGNLKKEEFHEDLSELVQHEIDHLHGILAIDHLKDLRKLIMRDEWEKRFR